MVGLKKKVGWSPRKWYKAGKIPDYEKKVNLTLKKLIIDDLHKNPLIMQYDYKFIEGQVELLLQSAIDIRLFKENIELLFGEKGKLSQKNKDMSIKLFDEIINTIRKYYTYWEKNPTWSLDNIISANDIQDFETKAHTKIKEPLMEMKLHEFNGGVRSAKTLTIMIPMWSGDKNIHKIVMPFVRRKGPVIECLWQKKAITSDVQTTALCYERMINEVYETLKTAKEKYSRDNINNIHIICCSAGVPIGTGAIRKLYENGDQETLDLISDVTLVTMAASFAYCYRYGSRTKHIGEVAEKNGWGLDKLESKFAHMAPITAIPALNKITSNKIKGKVTWISSASDLIFPIKTQFEVKDAIWKTGNKIRIMDIPNIGHIGICALYYVFGAGVNDEKLIRKFIQTYLIIKLGKGTFRALRKTYFPMKVIGIIAHRIYASLPPKI